MWICGCPAALTSSEASRASTGGWVSAAVQDVLLSCPSTGPGCLYVAQPVFTKC
jgi:hypothetical protein